MADTARIGLIGCGHHGRNNLSPGLASLDSAELVSCADPDELSRSKARQEFGYDRAYSSYEEMLDIESLDGVIISVRNDQLREVALSVIARGTPIFLEKPVALHEAGAIEVRDAANKADVKVMVDYSLRFAESRMFVKELVDQGIVGDITHIVTGKGSEIPREGWKGDLLKGGGDIMHHSVHSIDQILWILNAKPERVYSEILWQPNKLADYCSMFTVRFANDVLAQHIGSQRVGGGMDFLEVIGVSGRIRTEYPSGKVYVHSTVSTQYKNPTIFQPQHDLTMKMYFDATKAWIKSVLDDTEPSINLNDAVNVLQITDAIFESDRTKAPVSLV